MKGFADDCTGHALTVGNNSADVNIHGVGAAALIADTLSIPAVSFSGLEAKVNSNGALDNNASATNKGWHIVQLPSGSVISALRICGRDFDNPGQIVAKLFRKGRLSSPFSVADQIATVSSGTTFSDTNTFCFASVDLNATFATVDNTLFSYFVQMELTNFVQANSVEIDH